MRLRIGLGGEGRVPTERPEAGRSRPPPMGGSNKVAKPHLLERTLPDGSVTLHSTLYRLPTALMYIPAPRRSGGNLAETAPGNARIPPDSFRQALEA